MTTARAPGKVILLGEHAVVYGQPALAVPVQKVQATVSAEPLADAPLGTVRIVAPDVGLDADLASLPDNHPLALAVRLTLDACDGGAAPAIRLSVNSDIPVASGLGSGAAVSVATIRAIALHLDHPLPLERQSSIAYEVEKLHHGTPSGIDNTVVTYAQPVFFVRGQAPIPFDIGRMFHLAIADSGRPASTAVAVAKVRAAYESDPGGVGDLFNAIGGIVEQGRGVIASGDIQALGRLMDDNHTRLCDLGVSLPDLDRLVAAARQAGALGAKLSGGGLGGNIIALLPEPDDGRVEAALRKAGAAGVITTRVEGA
jgi:mevalonate kinase